MNNFSPIEQIKIRKLHQQGYALARIRQMAGVDVELGVIISFLNNLTKQKRLATGRKGKTNSIPTESLRILDLAGLFWMAEREGGCLNLSKPYGAVTVARKSYSAHRVMYTICYGQIPEGMDVDHMCENTRCINPYHLQAVTQRANIKFAYDESHRLNADRLRQAT